MDTENQKQITINEVNGIITLTEKISEDLKPIFELDTLDCNLPQKVTDIFKQKKDMIKSLSEEKEKVIKNIIGQMYKGVLIPKILSIRNGEVFEYRCQYHPSILNIKNKIMNNLHEINDKLTTENMDILEFCLEKVDEEEKYNYQNNRNNRSSRGRYKEFDANSKNLDFEEIKLIEINKYDEIYEKEIKINIINGFNLNNDGEITFYYKYNKEYQEEDKPIEIKEVKATPSLKNSSQSMFYLKFEKEIKEMAKDFIVELNEKIRVRKEELDEIKEKGSVQLMICEIADNSENVNGYN